MTPEWVHHLLTIGFSEADQARMHELAVKNQEEQITSTEREELNNFVTVADALTLLQAQARLFLKRNKLSRSDHR